MSKSNSPLDSEPFYSFIALCIAKGETNSAITRSLYAKYLYTTSEKSIRRFRQRHELNPDAKEKAYVNVNLERGEAVGAGDVTSVPVLIDPDVMLRERGLNPEEWFIDNVSPNEWEGPGPEGTIVKYHQTKFHAKLKRQPTILPVRSDGWKAPKKAKQSGKSRFIVIVGDQQAPYQDPNLHRLFCSWLDENKPDEGVSLGDTYDFPDISRHPSDPENDAKVNECLQAGYDVFRGYAESSPDTRWKKLLGNHDERIRILLANTPKARPLYDLKRPDSPEAPGEFVYNLGFLGRLDELDIEIIEPHGSYEMGQIQLSDKLAVRHGWIARKGSGASALATLDHLGFSVIVGHTHRQSIVHHTKHEITGSLRTVTGVETGCMCRVEQTVGEDGRIWPNYTTAPDWNQGFVTVNIHEDGFFNIDLAKYINGTLIWRDQQWR